MLDALAALHAACWGYPPRGVWTDEVSAKVVGGEATRPPFLRLIADSTLRTIRKRWPDLLSADVVATGVKCLDHYDAVASMAWVYVLETTF